MPKPRVRIPPDDELRRITTRAVAEIVPHQEFVDGLLSGKPMRLKMGFDPTVPVITLGWAVGLRKLRQLQDLGHTVVIIIGDWTARIGDPSGASQTRPMLTSEEVQANSEAILRQFYKILDEPRTEIRRQSEWFDPFTLTDVVRLSARYTVAQMLQRRRRESVRSAAAPGDRSRARDRTCRGTARSGAWPDHPTRECEAESRTSSGSRCARGRRRRESWVPAWAR